jgi:hypothetical protein
MKSMVLIGVAIMVLGIIALVNKGITYTSPAKYIGAFEASAIQDATIPLSPFLGAIALAGGVTMIVMSSKQIGKLAA